jgi:membrane protein CcdC involved in cytochrome C biogenesis
VDPLQNSFFNGQVIMPDNQNIGSIVFLVVILVLLLQLRTRRVRLLGLVLMPIFMLLLTIPFIIVELFSGPLGVVLLVVGFTVGAGIGVAIGSMMEVKIDEKDGSMVLKGSLLAVLLWAAIIGLKIYGKDLLGGIGLIDAGLITSTFLMLTVGMMISRRAFVYWRYLQMKKSIAATASS